MTERYTGWTHGRPRRNASSPHDSPLSTHHPGRVLETQNTGFTAINPSKQLVSAFSAPLQPVRPPDSGPLIRHPEPLARYLGIGGDEAEPSALDRLVNVTASPPASPSESRVPKRKKPGERYASDLKQSAKRARSDNALASSTKPPRSCASEEPVDCERLDCSMALSKTQLSQKSPSPLKRSKYRAQSSQSPGRRRSQSTNAQTISLVAPLTSFDKIQASSGGGVTYNLATTCSDRAVPRGSALGESRPYGTAKLLAARRAPSTGSSLAPILEEQLVGIQVPSIEHEMKPREVQDVSGLEPEKHSSLIESHLSGLRHGLHDTHVKLPARNAHNDHGETPAAHRAHLQAREEFSTVDAENLFSDMPVEAEVVHEMRPTHSPGKAACLGGLPTPQPSSDLPTILASDDFLKFSDTEIDEFTRATGETTASTTLQPSKPRECLRPTPTSTDPIQCPPPKSVKLAGPTQLASSATSLQQVFHSETLPPPPVVRLPWPNPIPTLSPLLNIRSTPTLRTCFRTGEALNIGCASARLSPSLASDSILIELYARILASWRPTSTAATATAIPKGQPAAAGLADAGKGTVGKTSGRQIFTLTDLWTDGPRVRAEWAGWTGSAVFEHDASLLLTAASEADVQPVLQRERPKMGRFVGRMRRERGVWLFQVLSAWSCEWDDVEFVRRVLGC